MTPTSTTKSTRQALLVLGMHRSGTSALARVLNLLGVELGADLLPPAADNETGFWEHRQVQYIHDQVYGSLGRDWTHVSALPARWWERADIRPYRAQLRKVLARDFSKCRLWGVKDPRLCAMLPLWRPLLKKMHCQAKCVLIFRNPAEVARSLEKRDGIAPSRTYLLWLRAMIGAERGSRGLARSVTTYELILGNWQEQLARIGRDLNIDWPTRGGQNPSQAVEEFLRPGSRHHQVRDEIFLKDGAAPELVRRAYAAALQSAASGRCDSLSQAVDQIAGELDEGQPTLTRFVEDFENEHRSKMVACRLAALDLQGELAAEHNALEELKKKLADQDLHIRHLQVQGRHLTDDVQGRIRAMADLDAELAAARRKLTQLERRISELETPPGGGQNK